jgi:6-phosphogluconolactonase (cycloisomerase 2 family)
VHRITPGSSELISRLSILPPADEPHRPSLGASEIVLLPPVRAGGPSLLIASNRDSPNAEGDAIALFSVSANGSKVEPTPEGFVKGIGRHLRGVSADAEARFVAVCARNGGGLAMFERKGEDGLQLEEVARLDVERTVCPLWIS